MVYPLSMEHLFLKFSFWLILFATLFLMRICTLAPSKVCLEANSLPLGGECEIDMIRHPSLHPLCFFSPHLSNIPASNAHNCGFQLIPPSLRTINNAFTFYTVEMVLIWCPSPLLLQVNCPRSLALPTKGLRNEGPINLLTTSFDLLIFCYKFMPRLTRV